MTTYTAIPDSDIDPESPITTTMMTRMRDNPIAITEGATGAPRIVGDALSNSFTTGSQAISASGTWTPPAGVYQFAFNSLGSPVVELLISGTWRATGSGVYLGFTICDGTNMRIRETVGSSATTIYYQKF